ncbi:MAG: hypothetical protein WCW56_02080 [Candidatus Paceibacterota bacterium]|jgi:hypothetical protein
MGVITILIDYLLWHYSKAVVSLLLVFRNLFLFITNLFSLPLLFRTWLSPWRRLDEGYTKNITDIGAIASTLVLNILMRLVGFIMRTGVIAIGLLTILFLTLLLPLVLAIWLLLPFIIIFLFLLGIGLLFK